MTRHIRLMADYGGYMQGGCMLWVEDPPSIGPIEPEKLPLGRETITRLRRWAGTYNDRLNWDDPANTPDWKPEELQDFEDEGVRLWLRLREELSGEFEVHYYSELLHRHVSDPSELNR